MRFLKPLAAIASLIPLPLMAQDIVFGWIANPSTPQVDVAMAEGYFEDAGLNVQIVPFVSGRETFEALIGGQIDVAFMAEFPAATGILTDQPFAIIAELSRYQGMRIIGKGEPLSSIEDLAGKRIGTSIGTNADYYLSEVLAAGDVQTEIVNAASSDLVAALSRGDVDMIVPFPTVRRIDLVDPRDVAGQKLLKRLRVGNLCESGEGEQEGASTDPLPVHGFHQFRLKGVDGSAEPIPARCGPCPAGLGINRDQLRGVDACIAEEGMVRHFTPKHDMPAGRNRRLPVRQDRRLREVRLGRSGFGGGDGAQHLVEPFAVDGGKFHDGFSVTMV